MPLSFGSLVGAAVALVKDRAVDVLKLIALFLVIAYACAGVVGPLAVRETSAVLRQIGVQQDESEIRATLWRIVAGDASATKMLMGRLDAAMSTGGEAEATALVQKFLAEDPKAEQEINRLLTDASKTEPAGKAADAQALMNAARQGDTQAQTRLIERVRRAIRTGQVEDIVGSAVERLVLNPTTITLLVLLALAGLYMAIATKTYLYLLALGERGSFASLFGRALGLVPGMVGVAIWMFIRSFVWIPVLLTLLAAMLPPLVLFIPLAVLAIFALALVFVPRLVFATMLYIRDRNGVMRSVEMSYESTRNYWGKIVGNGLLWLVCFAVTAKLVGVVLGMLALSVAPFVPALFAFMLVTAVNMAVGQFAAAVNITFWTQLGLTILANPRQVVPTGSMVGPVPSATVSPSPTAPAARPQLPKPSAKKPPAKPKKAPAKKPKKADTGEA